MVSRRQIMSATFGMGAMLALSACAPEDLDNKTIPNDQITKGTQIKPTPQEQKINGVKYTMTDTSLIIGPADAENKVTIYADLACPHCAELKKGISEVIESKITPESTVSFEFINFNLLGGPFTYPWSIVAAAALAVFMDQSPDQYMKAEKILYRNQPVQRSKDAVNPEYLISLLNEGEVEMSESFIAKIREISYYDWIARDVTQHAVDNGVKSTPFVKINGEHLENVTELKDRIQSM